MNKIWSVLVVLLSVNLVASSPINADSPLIDVEIHRGVNPQRLLVDGALNPSYVWKFDNKDYTILLAIDERWYNRIRNQQQKRSYDHRHFPQMVYKGVESLEKLIREFNEVIPRTWSDERRVNFVLAFVQAVHYEKDKTTGYDEFYKYPTETLVEGIGDCEDSSILFAAIISGLGFKSALLLPPKHLAVGVKGDFRGGHVLYGNDEYYYCETTGEGWKLGNMPKEYEGITVKVMPVNRNPIRPKQVTPQIIPPRPQPPSPPSPDAAFQNGMDLYYKARYNEAIKSLQLSLYELTNPEQRAEAYMYLGVAEYAFSGGSPLEAETITKIRFQEALRQNPDQESLWHGHHHPRFTPWFEEVRRESIGELTVSASRQQTEIWIYGNGITRKKLGTGTNPIKLRLFKGNYTVEGIYAGESTTTNIKIEPSTTLVLKIKIQPDDSPPIIVLQDTILTAKVNKSITIKAQVTDDTSIKSVYLLYGFARSDNSEPAEYVPRKLTESDLNEYTGYIPPQKEVGYIWYYLTATDEEENESKTKKRVLKIKRDGPYIPLSQSPIIVLQDTIRTANVNQRIPIKAKVTDDKSVKSVYLFYAFSPSSISEPSKYEEKVLTQNRLGSDIYIGHIPAQYEAGYIWYYLTATDEEENESKTKKIRLVIQRDSSIPPKIPEEPRQPHTPSITDRTKTIVRQGVWANYAWSSNVFDNGASVFDWNRGDAISFSYLREGRSYRTFGAQLDYSYQNPSNVNATLQWGPNLGKSPIVFTFLGGVTGYSNPNESIYITPILGAGLKYYPLDRVTVDVTGSLKFQSNFDTTYLHHYEIGTRIYITDSLNLEFGYSQWHLGGENIKRMQIGLGITF